MLDFLYTGEMTVDRCDSADLQRLIETLQINPELISVDVIDNKIVRKHEVEKVDKEDTQVDKEDEQVDKEDEQVDKEDEQVDKEDEQVDKNNSNVDQSGEKVDESGDESGIANLSDSKTVADVRKRKLSAADSDDEKSDKKLKC